MPPRTNPLLVQQHQRVSVRASAIMAHTADAFNERVPFLVNKPHPQELQSVAQDDIAPL